VVAGPPLTFASVAGPGTQVYYRSGPAMLLTPGSGLNVEPWPGFCLAVGGTFQAPNYCCQNLPSASPAEYAPTASIDVGGFIPPFRVDAQ
jgi:hypothetical protein